MKKISGSTPSKRIRVRGERFIVEVLHQATMRHKKHKQFYLCLRRLIVADVKSFSGSDFVS